MALPAVLEAHHVIVVLNSGALCDALGDHMEGEIGNHHAVDAHTRILALSGGGKGSCLAIIHGCCCLREILIHLHSTR